MFKKIIWFVCLILVISTVTFANTIDTFGKEVLKPGMDHQDVVLLKLSMMILGYYDTTSLDAIYDDQLQLAVKAYQKDKSLDQDGIVGAGAYSAIKTDNGLPVIVESAIKPDQKNHDVRVLKVALRSLNYLMVPVTDDVFDSATEEALKAFQLAQSIEADGIAGKATIEKLVTLKRAFFIPQTPVVGTLTFPKLQKGMENAEVVVLQKALALDGVFTGPEFAPRFGALTETAVKAFQIKYGLKADGVAGEGTILQLVALGYVKKGIPAPAPAPVVSRGASATGFGEYIAWADASALLERMKTVVTVQDLDTGKTFKLKMSYGHNHVDVEAMSAADAQTVKTVWGGNWTWERRAVLVYYKDRVFAASMNAMPHAGLDKSPEGITVSGRSGGFGKGYNYDSIKGNGMDGHFCLHFKGSKLHGANKIDSKHQAMVKKAAGIK